MQRLRNGTLHRFESVTELLEAARCKHPDAEIWSGSENGEFLLRIRDGSVEFETLIAHFEGEMCYAVMLPWDARAKWLVQFRRAMRWKQARWA